MNQLFYLFGAIIFFLSVGTSSAQSLDSLYNQYYTIQIGASESGDWEAYSLLKDIVDKEMFISYDRVLLQIDTVALLGREVVGEKEYNRLRYRTKGFAYAIQGNNLKALDCYRKYAQVFDKKGADDGYFLIDVGNLYFNLRLYKIAKKTYQEAEGIFVEAIGKDELAYKGLGTVYGNYALIASQQGELDTGFYYSKKYLELQEQIVKDTFQLAFSHYMLGGLYIEEKQGREDLAAYHYKKAIEYLSNPKLKEKSQYQQFIRYLPVLEVNMAYALDLIGQDSLSTIYFAKSIKSAESLDLQGAKLLVAVRTAEIYFGQQKYEEAIPLLDSALVWAKARKNYLELGRTLKVLIEIYSLKKDYAKAFDYTTQYMTMRDSTENKRDELMLVNEMVLEKENQITIAQQRELIEKEKVLINTLYVVLVLVLFTMLLILIFAVIFKQKNKLIKTYSEEIEASNKTKEVMLSAIGHDLRSPFSVVIGHSSQLLEFANKTTNWELKKKLEQLHRASKQAYMMMDGLLQWVVLRKQNYKVNKQVFAPQKVLQKTVADLGGVLENNKVTIAINVPTSIQINSDQALLQIVFRNIITNAIKYSFIHGEIQINALVEEGQLHILVQDTGEGFSDELLEQIAEEDALSIAQKGHGLGLSIVREICETLDFGIDISNNVLTKGATVSVQIPQADVIQLPTDSEITKQQPAPSSTKLINHDRILLQPFVVQLKAYEVFEGTAIQKVLSQINLLATEEQPAIKDWLSRLKRSINENDDSLYHAILNEI